MPQNLAIQIQWSCTPALMEQIQSCALAFFIFKADSKDSSKDAFWLPGFFQASCHDCNRIALQNKNHDCFGLIWSVRDGGSPVCLSFTNTSDPWSSALLRSQVSKEGSGQFFLWPALVGSLPSPCPLWARKAAEWSSHLAASLKHGGKWMRGDTS